MTCLATKHCHMKILRYIDKDHFFVGNIDKDNHALYSYMRFNEKSSLILGNFVIVLRKIDQCYKPGESNLAPARPLCR
jgi:hypothetical protein